MRIAGKMGDEENDAWLLKPISFLALCINLQSCCEVSPSQFDRHNSTYYTFFPSKIQNSSPPIIAHSLFRDLVSFLKRRTPCYALLRGILKLRKMHQIKEKCQKGSSP